MKIKYYRQDPYSNTIKASNSLDVHIDANNSFGIKSRKKLKPGNYVKIYTLDNKDEKGRAKVVELKNGLPHKLELPGGKIIEVFNLIMELLPVFVNIWLRIKAIFKK